MERDEGYPSSFKTGQSAQERGFSHVPDCYLVDPSQRPSVNSTEIDDVPVVDLAGLRMDPAQRSLVIRAIRQACLHIGFFQVVNHGIPETVMEKALAAAFEFFQLPLAERMKFRSDDVQKPVRYSTSLKDGVDKIQFWRIFLKQYANPLKDWIQFWPEKPPTYREDMGRYSEEVMKLAMELTEAITESLGLGPTYLSPQMERGMQVMTVNCYPPCPEPELTLGLPPHSDYSFFTILQQSSPGLEILDPRDDTWKAVTMVPGALQVNIGDHVEVLSNGAYKSILHRARVNSDKTRVSLASLHSLGKDVKVGPAPEILEATRWPAGYKKSSFQDFLVFLSKNDLGEKGKRFVESLKIGEN
ncbi:hypothetical protein V2J09_007939 [Rumex salicifolius]